MNSSFIPWPTVRSRFLHWRPVCVARYHAYRILLSSPKRVECNLCQWRGRHFLTYGQEYVLCPQCGSQIRHRLIAMALRTIDFLNSDRWIKGKRVLHFAPEYCLGLLFRNCAQKYMKADWLGKDFDIKADLCHMTNILDASFDVLVANDVLEHIPNDRAALSEIFRVLADPGLAILTVPQVRGRDRTLEDPQVNTDRARRLVYGQADHVRLPGRDYVDRILEAGFRATVVNHESFAPEDVKCHVLYPPSLSGDEVLRYERNIFFCFKETSSGNSGGS